MQTNSRRVMCALFLLANILLLSGCSTISPNTVTLSTEVTARIKDIEKTHIYSVNMYFDSERARIEKFMEEQWIPLFLRNFVGQSQILELVKESDSVGQGTRDNLSEMFRLYLDDPNEAAEMANTISSKLNQNRHEEENIIKTVVNDYVPDDQKGAATIHALAILHNDTPAILMMEFVEAAYTEIQLQRQELLVPIEKARQTTVEQLRLSYADIYAGQGVITGRLEAAARRSDQQNLLIDAIGGEGTAAKINKKIAMFAEGVNKAFAKLKSLDIDPDAIASMAEELKKGIHDAVEKSGLNEP